MCPEQPRPGTPLFIAHELEIGFPRDIFALARALVLLWTLTGDAPSSTDVWQLYCQEKYEYDRMLRIPHDRKLHSLIHAAGHCERAQRPTAQALLAEVRRLLISAE